MSRNKLEGRYAGKHNGRHYRDNIEFMIPWCLIPWCFYAHCAAVSHGIRQGQRKAKYSRKQRKANY